MPLIFMRMPRIEYADAVDKVVIAQTSTRLSMKLSDKLQNSHETSRFVDNLAAAATEVFKQN